jgi:hypothetical protein
MAELRVWNSEHFHTMALEIDFLLEDVTRLLRRCGIHTSMSPVEMQGYTRRMDRLREIGNALKKLSERQSSMLD